MLPELSAFKLYSYIYNLIYKALYETIILADCRYFFEFMYSQ